jgi:hypothetical protein
MHSTLKLASLPHTCSLEPHDARRHSADVRCVCGSLIARLVATGVELKCKRCKRITVVPLSP